MLKPVWKHVLWPPELHGVQRRRKRGLPPQKKFVNKQHVIIVVNEMQRMVSQTHQRMLLYTQERHFGAHLRDRRNTSGITLQRKRTVTFISTKPLSILMRK